MNTNNTEPSKGSKEVDSSSLPRIPKKKKQDFTSVQDSSAAAAVASSVSTADNIHEPTKNEGGNTKMGNDKTEEAVTNKTTTTTSPPKRKPGRPPKDKSPTLAKLSAVAPKSLEGFDPPILRKGDLVRLSNEQRSGRIQGGLARISRPNFSPDDTEHKGIPVSYDIEYVLGGKVSNIERYELSYTTATAEGLIDASENNSRGHHLRRRRSAAKGSDDDDEEEKKKAPPPAKKSKKKSAPTKAAAADGESPKKRGKGRPPGSKNKRKGGDTSSSATAAKKQRGSTKTSVKSEAAKLGWEKRRASEAAAAKSGGAPKAKSKPAAKAKSTSKRGSNKRNNSTTDASESEMTSGVEESGTDTTTTFRRMDLYTKHRREMEKSLHRIEKVDRFGFFLDETPPEFDENYNVDDDEKTEEDDDDDEDEKSIQVARARRTKSVQFPDQPPFNFHIIRKRLAAGRYDIDMVALEMKRRSEIKAMFNTCNSQDDNNDEAKNEEATLDDDNNNISYDELAKTMCHPIAIDWDTFNVDVLAMCEAAMIRDPDGLTLGSGHLGWAANKVKKMMEEIYNMYGNKRRLEVEESEARYRYDKVLATCGNMEAAMQGDWRTKAFPERKYERLETSSVICDGLSPKDRSYAMYELETKLPDSFVGLAYTYDDSGQHSETWMKTVADETQAKPKRPRKRKIFEKDTNTDDSVSTSVVSSKSENKAAKAALALAKDDGVVRAQVQTTMTSLLIQVQDHVMTDLGVMHKPEARSANWDDGDRRRDYRGGGAEVEQGTHSGFSLPEVAEQEVWGLDCYTRKNVMALIESEFSPEIAIEFVEKWLLPAINACPVDLAHKMSTACRILEGLDPVPPAKGNTKSLQDSTLSVTDDVNDSSKQTSVEEKNNSSSDLQTSSNNTQESSSVFLRTAMEPKIKEHGPPWLKAAARSVRLASDSMDDDFFRIHPKGHGSVVISEDGLKANSLVTYYRGEVYPAWRWCEKLDAIEHVQKQLDLRPNLPDFYNMAMERPKKDPRGYCLLFVDASRKSGLGSSFSHSCNPTCEVRVVSLHGKLSLSMTTLRDLEQGEELTFDYNAVTESLNEFRFAVCLCGQRKCRGSFLHFATADCYQQVLSRNSPISARFANLVRGCMKQVMSKEDSELLLKHGFDTAAFGAVSFNHHVSNLDPNSTADSIENVPVWLRTFVADCLRYIEYERRALPVALLCNQMERMEKKTGKKKTKKASLPKQMKRAPSNDSSSEVKSKTKPITGSKPQTSYFFFLNNQRSKYESMIDQEHGPELKGLERSQAINKAASRAWGNLTEDEKEVWKKKSIADWKKNGGKEKAKLEKERLRALERAESIETSKTKKVKDEGLVDKENDQLADQDVNIEETIEAKTISFADADAEGFSAMEQRIQQLAQSLSRVGRVLDRHRESVFAERKDLNSSVVDSNALRNLVHSPLKIMSDGDVVNWTWFGLIPKLLSTIESHFPERSLLRKLLSRTIKAYPVLSAYSESYAAKSLEKKWKHSCTSADARRLVREALLKLRSNIISFLSFAEKSTAQARSEKRREQARAREEKKKKQSNSSTPEETKSDDDVVMADDQQVGRDSFQSTGNEHSLQDASNLEEEAMPMRGGGDEDTPADSSSCLIDAQPLSQTSTLKPMAVAVPSMLPSMPLAEATSNGSLTPPMDAVNTGQESTINDVEAKREPTFVQSTDIMSEDVQSLLQLSKAPKNFGTTIPEHPVSNLTDCQPSAIGSTHMTEVKVQAEVGTPSPSRLQELINAVASNSPTDGPEDNAPASFNLNASTAAITNSPSLGLPEGPLSTPMSGSSAQEPSSETKKKKVVVPLSDDQLRYLKDWLYDPKHILNPYPTDEEKSTMMKDIGIERKRLEGWFTKNRQKVLYPEVRPIEMKWKKLDQEQWDDFRKKRYMLEATADMLLMYANTNTFFMLEPFRQFDSTPIEVYARELGNEVPRHFAMNSQKNASAVPDVEGDVQMEDSIPCTNGEMTDQPKKSTMKKANIKDTQSIELCSPDDVVDKVAVDYGGEYVLSQLLQWVSGGIGVKKGLPNIYGCVMLPPLTGCWDELQYDEVKLSSYTKWNRKTATKYDAHARPKLAEWIGDRYQRGSPWDEDLAKYFCPLEQDSPDPTMPIGSPVLDYLVTGHDDNIRHIQAALTGKSETDQGKSKLSTSERLQSTVDEGMPAQAVANWVQCEDPKCHKWRKLPWHVDVDLLPENFFCKDNIWNPKSQRCEDSEDEWDMDDAPIKFDTNAYNFEVGVWFDVQREGKVGYHEAQVAELDFESSVKRVKFHFWRLSSDRDEWIEVGSPRIAPHHAYTPRPRNGYKTEDIPGMKNKGNTKKISKESGGTSGKRKSSDLGSVSSLNFSEEQRKDCAEKFTIFPQPTVDYLNSWISQHTENPFPDASEKAKIMRDTGLSKRQVGDWMARARKKLRKKTSPNEKPTPGKVKPQTDVTTVSSVSSSSTKVENLLLALKNPHQLSSQAVVANVKVAQPAPAAAENPKVSMKGLENYMKGWLMRPENAGTLMPTLTQKESIVRETGIEKKRLEGWFFRARKKLKKEQDAANQPAPSTVPSALAASTVQATTTISGTAPTTQQHNQLLNHFNPPPQTSFPNMSPMQGSKASAAKPTAIMPTSSTLVSGVKLTVTNQNLPNITKSKSSTPGLTDKAKAYMTKWLLEHQNNPYPTREEKNAMMSLLEIADEKKLEGWFCRARKRQKNKLNPENKEVKKSTKPKPTLHPIGLSANANMPPPPHAGVPDQTSGAMKQPSGVTNQTNQSSGSVSMKSSLQGTISNSLSPNSGFASLLSAVELRSSGNQDQAVSVVRSNASHSQQVERQPAYSSQHDGSYRNVGAREEAILSSIQRLKSMEQNQAPHRQASQPNYQHQYGGQSHQASQRSGDSNFYHQGAVTNYSSSYSSYPQHSNSQSHQQRDTTDYSQAHHQGAPSNYSSHSYEQPPQHPSSYRSSPAEYSSYRSSSAEYPYQQHTQGGQQQPPNHHYQQSSGGQPKPEDAQGYSYGDDYHHGHMSNGQRQHKHH